MKFDWQPRDAGYIVEIGNITLCVSPDRINYGRPKRGTKWHAQVSIWDEKTRTMSRYGSDVYMQLCDSYKEAMRLAEAVYLGK